MFYPIPEKVRSMIRELQHRIDKQLKTIVLLLSIFYAVGIVLIFIPDLTLFIKQLTPLVLFGSYFLVLLFDRSTFNWKLPAVLIFIAVFSYLVEMIGVKSGLIFGNYQYGENLGLKIWDTPLMIGLNWLFLVYTTYLILDRTKFHAVIKVVLASLLMVSYDLILEQMAPVMDMWSWKEGIIPLKNYLAWFILAAVFHSIMKAFAIEIKNRIAEIILLHQFLFFLFLYILKHYFSL
jgi:putative membrane protein